MSLMQEIVETIKINRISTTEVADCLGKSGVLPNILPLTPGFHKVGPVRYVYGFHESNWSIHEQIRDVAPGEIVLVDGIAVNGRALFGELVTKFLVYYRRAEAVVALGVVRDANSLIRMKYPVWCRGVSPVGCFNTEKIETDDIKLKVSENKKLFDGAVCVCDDSGVVIIPSDILTEDFCKKLEDIENLEDEWFYCIDHRKWDTYDTVCLKRYLKEQ